MKFGTHKRCRKNTSGPILNAIGSGLKSAFVFVDCVINMDRLIRPIMCQNVYRWQAWEYRNIF